MDEKKQIEEMVNIITTAIPNDICKDDYCKDCNFYSVGKKCYIARALYNAGYRKSSEWISVNERLPEEVACYLVNIIDNYNLNCVTFTYYTKNYGWGVPNVTHWMPLPKAPKEKGGVE